MLLSAGQSNFKRCLSKDLKKISPFTPLIITLLLVVFISLVAVGAPVLAAENRNVQVAKKQTGFFDRVAAFVKNPFVSPALAQSNQSRTSVAPKPVQQKQSFLAAVWNFITAPYRALFASTNSTPKAKANVAPRSISQRPVSQTTFTPASEAPAVSPSPSSFAASGVPAAETAVLASTAVATSVNTLNAGTTYVDLIGKTIIDSNGNLYPSNSALAQTDKPTLGTTTNKFSGLYSYQFSIDKNGGITTVLPGGIVKSSSKGVLSASAIELDSGDIAGTLQTGHGGTGNTTYAVGDILYSATANSLSKLAIGTANQVLTIAGGVPTWSSTQSVTTTSLGNGTAASPALNFASDTDTGLWRIGENNIALTIGGSAFSGISINGSGNVGIGVTGAATALQVNGSGMIGYASGTMGPNMANSLAVSGNVGIGTSTHATGYALDVVGSIWSENNLAVGSGGLTIYTSAGNVGIGTTLPNARLSIQGNVGIGYTGASQVLPANGLAVSGNVGIGVTTANNALQVLGGGLFSGTWGGAVVPVNGLIVEGSVGIGTSIPSQLFQVGTAGNALAFTSAGSLGVGTTTPLNTLDIFGNAQFRNTSGVALGITNSARVGVGTTAPGAAFSVSGATTLGTFSNTTGPANGLAVSGNVGIGTTTANSNLAVVGNAAIGTGFGSMLAPGNGLIVEGNTGIGTSVPSQLFQIGVDGTSLVFTSGGNLGIGVTTPLNTLDIIGSAQIRTAGAASFAVTNSNRVGIGTTAPGATLSVSGATTLGTFSNTTGPANGLAVSGNVGIGTTTANNTLSVIGSGLFSNTWTGAIAPTSGLIVEGSVGIGTSQPGTAALSVLGNVGLGSTTPRAQLEVVGNGSLAALFTSGNVGIGTTATGFNTLQVTGSIGIGTSVSNAGYALDVAGKVRASAGFNGSCLSSEAYANNGNCNQDVAEIYQSSEDVAPGDVLSIDLTVNKTVKKSGGVYDQNLMGIVSTAPGIILGLNGSDVYMGGESSTYSQTADPKKPAVALTGKVPVKVSTENGAIGVGDYLTSSSIPGVAMKATKAGSVIGQALSGYDGDGVGSVLVFVRLAYYSGSGLVDLPNPIDATGLSVQSATPAVSTSQIILDKLLAQRDELVRNNRFSEIFTDRIGAGLEIITPKLTANNLIVGVITPLEGQDLTLKLADDQAFTIKDNLDQTAISFDNLGNAYFKGTVVASGIKATQIEGLNLLADNVITNKISSLVDYAIKQQQAAGQASSSAQLAAVPAAAVISLDTSDLAKLNKDGGLTVGALLVNGEAEFKAKTIFNTLAEFISNVVFKADVTFLGRAIFGRDAAGLAVVKQGADSVSVAFSRAYDQTPFVNVTPTMYAGNDGAGQSILNGDVKYVVQNLSNGGFTIKLSKAAPADLNFSWTAIAVSNASQSSSTQPATAASPAATPTPQPSVSATPAPSSTPLPSESPLVSPVPSVSPEPSVTPIPSSTPEASPTPSTSPVASPSPSPTP